MKTADVVVRINSDRTDLVEQIDSWLRDKYKDVKTDEGELRSKIG